MPTKKKKPTLDENAAALRLANAIAARENADEDLDYRLAMIRNGLLDKRDPTPAEATAAAAAGAAFAEASANVLMHVRFAATNFNAMGVDEIVCALVSTVVDCNYVAGMLGAPDVDAAVAARLAAAVKRGLHDAEDARRALHANGMAAAATPGALAEYVKTLHAPVN